MPSWPPRLAWHQRLLLKLTLKSRLSNNQLKVPRLKLKVRCKAKSKPKLMHWLPRKLRVNRLKKTNLEEMNHHKHHTTKKHKKAHHAKKHHQKAAHSLMQTSEEKTATKKVEKKVEAPVAKKAPMPAPKAKNLIATKATNQDEFDKYSQNVDVPIDEIKAITLKVAPTFTRDHVESVTLKSFRKVVGYDTFNSIL